MPTFTKKMMKGDFVKLPPGDYQVEITNVSYKESERGAGKPWQKMLFITEVTDPQDHAGEKFAFSLFDNQYYLILDMLKSLGKKDSEVFDEKEQVSDEKIKHLLEGEFVSLKVGVKGEYNTVVEVLEGEKDDIPV